MVTVIGVFSLHGARTVDLQPNRVQQRQDDHGIYRQFLLHLLSILLLYSSLYIYTDELQWVCLQYSQ